MIRYCAAVGCGSALAVVLTLGSGYLLLRFASDDVLAFALGIDDD